MAIELHNADCFDFLKTMPDKCVDLVVTDPPYDIDTVGSGIMKKEHYQKELTDISNGFNFEILHELVRVMKKINIYIFCSNKQIYPLLNYFIKKLGGGLHLQCYLGIRLILFLLVVISIYLILNTVYILDRQGFMLAVQL